MVYYKIKNLFVGNIQKQSLVQNHKMSMLNNIQNKIINNFFKAKTNSSFDLESFLKSDEDEIMLEVQELQKELVEFKSTSKPFEIDRKRNTPPPFRFKLDNATNKSILRKPESQDLMIQIVRGAESEFTAYFNWKVKNNILKDEGVDKIKDFIKSQIKYSFSHKLGELVFIKKNKVNSSESIVCFSCYVPGPLYAYSLGLNLCKIQTDTQPLLKISEVEYRLQLANLFIEKWRKTREDGQALVANEKTTEDKDFVWKNKVMPNLTQLDRVFITKNFNISLFKSLIE
jgi:hypothetical protein